MDMADLDKTGFDAMMPRARINNKWLPDGAATAPFRVSARLAHARRRSRVRMPRRCRHGPLPPREAAATIAGMLRSIWSISSLLGGMGILLTGSGLLGILLGLRAAHEGFGNLTIGVVMSAFYIGYMTGAWVWPPLIRRVGHIRAFASFAATAAVTSLAYGLIVDPVTWWCLRIVNGMAIMGLYMVIESWLNERARSGRARIFSAYMMINLVAIAIGQYLIVVYGPDHLASFVIAAMLFCAGLLPIALTPLRQPVPIRTPTLSLRKLYRTSPVGVVGAFAAGLTLGAFWALSAIYARTIGLADLGIAHFTAAAIIGGALLQWPIGWFSDHHDRRVVLVWVCSAASLALAALGLVDLAVGLPLRPLWVVPLSFGFGAFLFSIYGLAVAQTHDRFPPSEALEATRGLLLVHGLGAASGPLLCGAVMHWLPLRGFPAFIGDVTLLLALFTIARIRKEPPVPAADRSTFRPMEQGSTIIIDDPDTVTGPETDGFDPGPGPTGGSDGSARPGVASGPRRWRQPSTEPMSRRSTDTIDDTPQAGLVREAARGTPPAATPGAATAPAATSPAAAPPGSQPPSAGPTAP